MPCISHFRLTGSVPTLIFLFGVLSGCGRNGPSAGRASGTDHPGYDVSVIAGGPVTFLKYSRGIQEPDTTYDTKAYSGVVLRLSAIRKGVKVGLSSESAIAVQEGGASVPLAWVQPISYSDSLLNVFDAPLRVPRPYGNTILRKIVGEDGVVSMHAGFIRSIGDFQRGEFLPYPFLELTPGMTITLALPESLDVDVGIIFEGSSETIKSIRFLDLGIEMPD